MQGGTHWGGHPRMGSMPSIINLTSKELEEEMAEAATESHEDPSEETEDLGPLEPDDSGKKTNPLPAFLLRFLY